MVDTSSLMYEPSDFSLAAFHNSCRGIVNFDNESSSDGSADF